jgi:hypothetical protein
MPTLCFNHVDSIGIDGTNDDDEQGADGNRTCGKMERGPETTPVLDSSEASRDAG